MDIFSDYDAAATSGLEVKGRDVSMVRGEGLG